MRILVLSAFLPTRESGGRVRLRALMRGLMERHSVSLLSFAPPDLDQATVAEVQGTYDDVVVIPSTHVATRARKRLLQLRSLASPRSYERLACDRREFQAALDRMLSRVRYDVVHVEGCAMAHYRLRGAAPMVLDEQNVEYDVLRRVAAVTPSPARRLYNELDQRKLRREEERAWRAAEACAMTSERDVAFVRAAAPRTPVAVVPNGVDARAFTPGARSTERGMLLFFGEMGYYPNTDAMLHFANDVLPLLRRRHPSAHLVIVGPSAPPAVQRLASPWVTITGSVPDVRPYLASAHAVVVPLRVGGGTRLKILEALAMGKPVVSTSLGAEGLAVTHGRELVLADGAEPFAAAVAQVLDDDALALALASAGRRLVERVYDWSASVRALEALYATTLSVGSRAA
jgi:glycosyltransferase involved in cell wall biosynthesis